MEHERGSTRKSKSPLQDTDLKTCSPEDTRGTVTFKADYSVTIPLMSKQNRTFLVGRNANTGKLTTVETARRHPNTHVVERMPKSGNGDTKK